MTSERLVGSRDLNGPRNLKQLSQSSRHGKGNILIEPIANSKVEAIFDFIALAMNHLISQIRKRQIDRYSPEGVVDQMEGRDLTHTQIVQALNFRLNYLLGRFPFVFGFLFNILRFMPATN